MAAKESDDAYNVLYPAAGASWRRLRFRTARSWSSPMIQEDRAKLFWSGTTWSFAADGEGTAIRDISTTIADAIAKARERFLAE